MTWSRPWLVQNQGLLMHRSMVFSGTLLFHQGVGLGGGKRTHSNKSESLPPTRLAFGATLQTVMRSAQPSWARVPESPQNAQDSPDFHGGCPEAETASVWVRNSRKKTQHCHSGLQQEKQDLLDFLSLSCQCGSYLAGVFGPPPQPSSGEAQSKASRPLLPPQPSLTAGEQTEVLLPLQRVQNTRVRVPKTSLSLV